MVSGSGLELEKSVHVAEASPAKVKRSFPVFNQSQRCLIEEVNRMTRVPHLLWQIQSVQIIELIEMLFRDLVAGVRKAAQDRLDGKQNIRQHSQSLRADPGWTGGRRRILFRLVLKSGNWHPEVPVRSDFHVKAQIADRQEVVKGLGEADGGRACG